MNDDFEAQKNLERSVREIKAWRSDFLNERFCGTFKFISEVDKNFISVMFNAIPSEVFSTPWEEWNKCVSVCLQKHAERLS